MLARQLAGTLSIRARRQERDGSVKGKAASLGREQQLIFVFQRRMLADNGMSPRCLANLLQRLGDLGKEAAGAGGRQSANVYIASHPATAERIDALGGPACE